MSHVRSGACFEGGKAELTKFGNLDASSRPATLSRIPSKSDPRPTCFLPHRAAT